ncbi:periplasmic iron-binding protein [Nitratireductor aquibiodomus RA22]|uniref:Iron(III) transport system substrate-binding protein n=2 Tax=Nitratireductor aquibiodomus TaxID=204799 RepID=A0A1H4MRD1_9HYPH|nr:ABC transporter substrate-binding protein [Nitratireductor aquibiodomus]EIM76081.1 periplasmic iron-binding protein [Nitratireductor aquibiodomus RA22]SEB85690.1 iron(III) transport system substrate-binding protein [Nitratireductor aquibiodomus]
MRCFVYVCAVTLLGLVSPSKAESILRVYSATDTSAVMQLIRRFEVSTPGVRVEYTEFNTSELYAEIRRGDSPADVVISSAMDLQAKLVNSGLAHAFKPTNARNVPAWAQWRDELYGFTFEPVAMVYNRAAFAQRELPRSRSELAGVIRDDPGFFNGRVGTYDIHRSGVGYLFATQDAQRGYQFSRLTESFGRARTKTFCCTLDILNGVASGELVFGYNVIGSYALSRANSDPRVGVYLLDDYTNVMTRTAFVPKTARNKAPATAFIDFLLSPAGQSTIARHSSLLPLHFSASDQEAPSPEMATEGRSALPIRLGIGLLTYLDRLKKKAFLADWEAAMQPGFNAGQQTRD